MKRSLFCVIFLVPLSCLSQTKNPIKGFSGIKFGSSRVVVITAIKAQKGKIEERKGPDYLIFTNIKTEERQFDLLRVYFFNNQAYKAEFTLFSKTEARNIAFYQTLIKYFSALYGKGDTISYIAATPKQGLLKLVDSQQMASNRPQAKPRIKSHGSALEPTSVLKDYRVYFKDLGGNGIIMSCIVDDLSVTVEYYDGPMSYNAEPIEM